MIFDIKMFDMHNDIIVVHSEGYESVLRHSHTFVELVYVKMGSAIHSIKGENLEINKGDIFVIASADEHSIKPVCDEKDFKIVNVIINRYKLDGLLLPECTDVFSNYTAEYASYIESIEQEYIRDDSSEDILLLYIKNLVNLFEIEKMSKARVLSGDKKRKKSINDYINSATAFIHQNYMRKLTLAEIAEAIGLYPAYLQKLFRENRNTGVIEYLIHYRMEKSSQYLIETDYTIEEISSRVGIGDLKNFYTTFKKFFQLTPIEYRRSHREEDIVS